MILYGLKTCDSCRKARQALPQAEFADVRDDGVPAEVVAKAVSRFGAAMVNTRSTTWRNLDAGDRALPPEALIAMHPTVMKRPLIVDRDDMWLGWSKETAAEFEKGR